MIKRKGIRFTVKDMANKYLGLQKQNYETICITEVLIDLHRILRERKIKAKDL